MNFHSRLRSQPSSVSKLQGNSRLSDEEMKKQSKEEIKFPKIKGIRLSDEQADEVDRKVLKLKRNGYGPIGCSRSLKLQKVLMMKNMSRRFEIELSNNRNLSYSLRVRANQKKMEKCLRRKFAVALTPQNYMSRIYI